MNRTDAVVAGAVPINDASSIEMFERFPAQLAQLIAVGMFVRIRMPRLILQSGRLTLLACRSLPPAFGIAVDPFLQLQRDTPLGQRHVGQSTREIGMLRIALAVMENRILKKLNRIVETSLPSRHSSVERLNVAERHIVIAVSEHPFRRLRDSNRISPFPLLK